jgi:Rieske Fe-S protein
MNSSKILLVVIGFLLINILSCSKDENMADTAIPNVEVNEKININDPLYNNLNNVGGFVYLNGGALGIILYRESPEVVRAYERTCTYDPTEVCSQLDVNVVTRQAADGDCCGSIFSLISNIVVQGPATKPMLEYQTTFDGTYVTVTN